MTMTPSPGTSFRRLLAAAGALALAAAGRPLHAASGPSVDELVAEALGKSPALAAARAEAAAARERISPAGTPPDPMVSLSYENDGASPSLGREMMTRLAVMAEQQLPWPGTLRLASRVAEADAEVVEARISRVALGVEADVRRAAARLLEAREARDLTRELEATWKGIEAVVESRYAAGLGTQQDVLRAQVERTRLLQQARRDEEAACAAEAELRRLLVRGPGEPVLLKGRLGDLRPEPPDEAAALAKAEADSPELTVAGRVLAREELAIDLSRHERNPGFVASAGYMNRGGLPMMWSAGLGVTVPLFSDRKQEARVREAEARRARAVAERSDVKSRLRARTEERLALLARLAEEARLDREALLVQDRLAVEAALASYTAGSVPFVTVLEAVSTERSDRRAALGRLAAFRVAEADLHELALDGAPMTSPSAPTSAPAAMAAGGGM